MDNRQLFLLVEGDDDERFFDEIIKPLFKEKYDNVMVWKYAQLKNTKVANFLKSIRSMGAEYIYVVDIDLAPCVTGKKQEIKNEFNNVDIDKLIVVIKEIEGWYLAGLDANNSKRFRIPPYKTTDDVSKEQFNILIRENFDSRINFMVELLKCFSIETAKQKNISFRYFIEKYNCEI